LDAQNGLTFTAQPQQSTNRSASRSSVPSELPSRRTGIEGIATLRRRCRVRPRNVDAGKTVALVARAAVLCATWTCGHGRSTKCVVPLSASLWLPLRQRSLGIAALFIGALVLDAGFGEPYPGCHAGAARFPCRMHSRYPGLARPHATTLEPSNMAGCEAQAPLLSLPGCSLLDTR
jgi:hypothetical protein